MGNLFTPKTPTVVAPTPQAPAPMPDTSSPGVMEARRKAQTDIMSRAGRSSTILTAPSQRGGGFDTYGSRALGSDAA